MRMLVAGATGAVGRHVVAEAVRRGHSVRALSRRPGPGDVVVGDALSPATLAAAMDGCDAVFSSVGASVSLGGGGWRSYLSVDVAANANLLAAAKAAGVKRFVYVSVHRAPAFPHVGYLRAHAEVEARLEASGLDHAILRPTGFFSAFSDFVGMARRGPLPLLRGGAAKSNPIHEADLAAACVAAFDGGPRVRDVGGPDVLSRKDAADLAFAAVGRPPAYRALPEPLLRATAVALRPFHPRLSHLFTFVATAMTEDFVAPVAGERRLADYLAEVARK
jgi:uncharacterized protein YbjT (DUF2867 family)